MEKEIIVNSLMETEEFAGKLAQYITPHSLITLNGDLGAGKTTFTKYLGGFMGVKRTINSPTFTILKIYQGSMPFYHIDAYRLEGIQQELGFEEIFEDEGVALVEWPDFINEQLPKERLEIFIHRTDEEEKRIFKLKAKGTKYEKLLEDLK